MRIAKRSLAFYRLYNKNYLSYYIQILIQLFLRKGGKNYTYKLIFNFLKFIKYEYKCLNLEIFLNKIFSKNCPKISFIFRKKATIIYFLPWYIDKNRSKNLIIRWFLKISYERKEKAFLDKLIFEFKDFYNGYGRTIQKIEDYYILAFKNKPFLKFLKKKRNRYSLRLKKFSINK